MARQHGWSFSCIHSVSLVMLTSYKWLFTRLLFTSTSLFHSTVWNNSPSASLTVPLSPSMCVYLFLMSILLPTVPCKCHSMAVQRRKRAQGQSARAWGQSGCASKAVKTILYGWTLSNSLSQFNSYCRLKLEKKTKALIGILSF